MEFKKLEIQDDRSWYRKLWESAHLRRTVLFMIGGAAISFVLFYISEGRYLDLLGIGDILKSMVPGALFGLFITNSPCARGRC